MNNRVELNSCGLGDSDDLNLFFIYISDYINKYPDRPKHYKTTGGDHDWASTNTKVNLCLKF